MLPTDYRSASIAFNVFSNGQWVLHITKQGSTRDAIQKSGIFLWDIRDLDGDGVPELITSPTKPGTGVYFTEWRTEIHGWNPRTGELNLRQSIDAGIPYLVAGFRPQDVSTSSGYSYPVLVGSQVGKTGLYIVTPDKRVEHVALCLK